MRSVLTALAAMCFVVLAGCSESKEDYSKRAQSFVDSLSKEADVNMNVAETRVRVWANAIIENKMTDPLTGETTDEYVFDFNKALSAYQSSPLYVMVKERRDAAKKSLDSMYTTVKDAPQDATVLLGTVKDIYSTYLKSYSLAFDSEGSLQSYRESVIATRSKLKEQLDAFAVEVK